jgi:uncharacterized membrane protein
MSENFYAQPVEPKLYSSESILIATFFGGPLVGGYLIAENFKIMGEMEKAKQTWVFAILGISVLLGFVEFIKNFSTFWYMIPLTYTAMTYLPMKWLQGNKIKAHMLQGGQMHKGDRVFVISFVGAVASMVGLLFMSILMQIATTGDVS